MNALKPALALGIVIAAVTLLIPTQLSDAEQHPTPDARRHFQTAPPRSFGFRSPYVFFPMGAGVPEKNHMRWTWHPLKGENGRDGAFATYRELTADERPPFFWHLPWGRDETDGEVMDLDARYKAMQTYPAAEAKRTRFMQQHVKPGDVIYLGSDRSESLRTLQREGRWGEWMRRVSISIAPVLDMPGVSLCVDSAFATYDEHPAWAAATYRFWRGVDEMLRINGGRLYFEPNTPARHPWLADFGVVVTAGRTRNGAHTLMTLDQYRGPGIVLYAHRDKVRDRQKLQQMRADRNAGWRIAVNFTAFRSSSIEEWRTLLQGPSAER